MTRPALAETTFDGASSAQPVRLRRIAVAAVASLHAELILAPKPGLVCPGDPGSHDDMDATTLMRGIAALRHGFVALVSAGAAGAPFAELQRIGIDAEAAMRRATGGVNTHRGAIFSVGLLAAAAGRCASSADAVGSIDAGTLRDALVSRWGRALTARPLKEASHGRAMAARYGAGGAHRQAARGFPGVFDVVLPALRDARRAGHDERGARLHALMHAVATTEDTNLLYRGGAAGLAFARRVARTFLETGGVGRDDRDDALRAIGRAFVGQRLSPGGSADLLAATLFVDRVTSQ